MVQMACSVVDFTWGCQTSVDVGEILKKKKKILQRKVNGAGDRSGGLLANSLFFSGMEKITICNLKLIFS